MKKIILLSVGIMVSILFVIFATSLFELLYYEREFSNGMYNAGLYLTEAIILVGCAWAFAALFYYAINSVSFSRWYHWTLTLAVATAIASLACHAYAASYFEEEGISFSHQLASFTLVCAGFEVVLYAVASFSIRWWSSNCRHTPIPE